MTTKTLYLWARDDTVYFTLDANLVDHVKSNEPFLAQCVRDMPSLRIPGMGEDGMVFFQTMLVPKDWTETQLDITCADSAFFVDLINDLISKGGVK